MVKEKKKVKDDTTTQELKKWDVYCWVQVVLLVMFSEKRTTTNSTTFVFYGTTYYELRVRSPGPILIMKSFWNYGIW